MMDWQDLLLWITIFQLSAIVVWELLGHYAFFKIPMLRRCPANEPDVWPDVAIIFAAKDEEREIEAAVRSMLQIEYPNLKYTAVNDRSTDGTGAILEQLAVEDPRLQVVHIDELPEGWLGKNHALHQAAQATNSDYLLFTDADVSFDSECVKRAVAYSEHHHVDHLAMFPKVPMPSLILNAFVIFFFKTFVVYYRAWRVANSRSKAFLGIGAFNMVRNSVFRELNGMERIRMEVVDDLMLGKLIKHSGFNQHVLVAREDISVPWYASIREMVVGLDKNTYAGVNYNPIILLTMLTAMTAAFLWPFVAVFLFPGTLRLLFLAICMLLILSSAWMALRMRLNPAAALLIPVIIGVFNFTIARAGIIFYVRGGIKWRDTLYTKDQLKRGRQ
ncbi:MAG: glycosyl transferase [Rhodopirellula sp.]|nr:glycosyl transferase [Rhodopirellula sp.]|tara:strand:- start:19801 stop:20964 length:1164 start_codon:yes stop_codon:yes gene_type:complete